MYIVEPGYYENGNFGLRVENVCVIKKANTKVIHIMYCYINIITAIVT